MDQEQRAQVRLILDHLIQGTEADYSRRMETMYVANSVRGVLKSGYTIKRGLDAMEQLATSLIDECIEEVGKIAMDFDAFALVESAIFKFETFLKNNLDSLVTKATGHSRHSKLRHAQYQEADRRFRKLWSTARRQLEIHRFTFTRPAPSLGPSPTERPGPASKARVGGGRPRSSHWDELWAHIAMQLYEGDLQPSKQADIENAMKDWFASEGIDAGDTPIRDRARVLWQKWEVSR